MAVPICEFENHFLAESSPNKALCVGVWSTHLCCRDTEVSEAGQRSNVSIKWPVRTYYLFISLYRCLFLSPSLSLFSLRHVRFRRTPAPSPAQFKGKINMDKPPWEYWPLRTSTILFNVLDCTLMDTPSHTSSNHLALSHPHFFFPPFSAVSSSPGESTFHLYLAVSLPIVRRVDNPEIGREQRWRCDISVTVLSRLIEVSVKRKRIWGTPLDEWSGCQCYSRVKNEKKYIGCHQYIIGMWGHLSHESRCAKSDFSEPAFIQLMLQEEK